MYLYNVSIYAVSWLIRYYGDVLGDDFFGNFEGFQIILLKIYNLNEMV